MKIFLVSYSLHLGHTADFKFRAGDKDEAKQLAQLRLLIEPKYRKYNQAPEITNVQYMN